MGFNSGFKGLKIRRLRPGLNPRTWVPKASTLPLDHRSRSAKYYNEQNKLFEQNSEDMNTLLKQQLSAVRLSLGAPNNTLANVQYNGNVLKEFL